MDNFNNLKVAKVHLVSVIALAVVMESLSRRFPRKLVVARGVNAHLVGVVLGQADPHLLACKG